MAPKEITGVMLRFCIFFLSNYTLKASKKNRPKIPLFSSLKFLVNSIGRNGNASRNTSLNDDLKNAKPEFVESLFCQAVIVLVVIKFASNFSIASQKQNASNMPKNFTRRQRAICR
jgi:hypothetical protein